MSHYTKTPSVFQMEMTECGAASLCMILAAFGCYIPLEEMRIETGVSRDGCNMKGIKQAAQKYGLDVHAYRKEPQELLRLSTPCIIHWNFNHFVVFEGIKGKCVHINDPAVGRRRLSMKELDEGFTGIVMTFARTDRFKKQNKKSTLLSFVSKRLQGHYSVIFKLLYIGVLLIFPGLVLPVLSQVFIDDILGNGYDWITKVLVFMGCSLFMQQGLHYYRSILLEKMQARLALVSGDKFLKHIFRLPASFFEQRYAGDLVSRMDNNQNVNEFLAGDLAKTALDILTAVFFLTILILYSPVLTGIGLSKVLICLLVVVLSAKNLTDATIKLQMADGKLNGAVSAGLSITDSIKASGVETEYSNRLLGYQSKLSALEQELSRRQQVLSIIPETTGKIVDVLLLLFGGLMVIRGQMTIGMLFAFNSLYDSFCKPVDALVGFFQKTQELRSNMNRVEDIEKHKQDSQYTQEGKLQEMTERLQGYVELSHITFGYNPIAPAIIRDLSICLQCGETMAFVGASGCGKSTIAKIVSGLYHPWSGDVKFDGLLRDTLPQKVLTQNIATVSQNVRLFSGTIRDNITMWDSGILEEELIQAAKDACIHDFIIAQPEGYDYPLQENASNLSGGQRQRIEIARALAIKPSILVMDEATSALDPIIEKKIMDAIHRRGCTCIVVAHRLSAIRDCNQIAVMKNGEIIEQGSHRSLMQHKGYYASLIEKESSLRHECLTGNEADLS